LLFFLCSHDSPCGRKEKCCLDKDTKYKKEKRTKKKTRSDIWKSLYKNGLDRAELGKKEKVRAWGSREVRRLTWPQEVPGLDFSFTVTRSC
jgi:hypothetical protein